MQIVREAMVQLRVREAIISMIVGVGILLNACSFETLRDQVMHDLT